MEILIIVILNMPRKRARVIKKQQTNKKTPRANLNSGGDIYILIILDFQYFLECQGYYQ